MTLDASVREFLDGVTHPVRRRDADTLLALMSRATGEPARMWGPSIVAFGEYHYRYPSGREGDAPAAAFSPRKPATTVYLADGVGAYEAELATLGPHTTGVGCLYLKDLEQLDLAVLERVVAASFAVVTAGDFGGLARDGGA